MNSAAYTIDDRTESDSFLIPESPRVEPASHRGSHSGRRSSTADKKDEQPGVGEQAQAAVAGQSWARDYVQLTKPRILFMILITVGAGAICAPGGASHWLTVIHALIGTMFVAASASVFNQVLEKHNDGAMRRTRNRPLPAGRLTSFESSVFGLACVIFGSIYLATMTNYLATSIAVATWVLYVCVYTPLKTISVWNTAIGTLPGAMPVLIGWCAVGGSLADWRAWTVTSIVILWQFPHFMSIAWLYRNDYAGAGYKMWTTTNESGRIAGWHAIWGALLLIPVAVVSALPNTYWEWLGVLLIIAIASQQAVASVRFHLDRNDITARRLLRSSLLVLPLILLAVVLNSAF